MPRTSKGTQSFSINLLTLFSCFPLMESHQLCGLEVESGEVRAGYRRVPAITVTLGIRTDATITVTLVTSRRHISATWPGCQQEVEMACGRPGDWVGGRHVVCLGNGSASVQGSKPPPSGATVESCRRGERPVNAHYLCFSSSSSSSLCDLLRGCTKQKK